MNRPELLAAAILVSLSALITVFFALFVADAGLYGPIASVIPLWLAALCLTSGGRVFVEGMLYAGIED